MPTYHLPTYLPTYPTPYLPSYVPTYPLTYLPTHLPVLAMAYTALELTWKPPRTPPMEDGMASMQATVIA